MIDRLVSLVSSASGANYVEARYLSRFMTEVTFVNGEQERMRVVETAGCGLRVLVNGCLGFSSTNEMSSEALADALNKAVSSARVLADSKRNKVRGLAESKMARGRYSASVNGRLSDVSIEDKVKMVMEAEKSTRRQSRMVKTASCSYREILDHKLIANSDGAQVEICDSKPEFSVTAVARRGAQSATAHEGLGITGGWNDLFGSASHLDYACKAADRATRLLEAKHAMGEKTTVILDPGMVGLLSHEAIGHTVEADFVLSGSVVRDKIGVQVASELITLVDSGAQDSGRHGAGTIMVDDEGIVAAGTVIIKDGILRSFLHNRETALKFGAEPTGNARAFQYNDEPLIRMRNTYVEPRSDKLEEMIKETRHGYLVKGARNGQADANGEFMFGAEEAYLIEKGEPGALVRGDSISGNAFEVLKSVDMVGDCFHYDIGTGYCGKYQPAKVDGGGPHIRCIAIVGGLQ